MTNPIVVFKCDQTYIREKFFLNKAPSPKKKEAKKDFFDMAGGYEPLFEYEKEKFNKEVEYILLNLQEEILKKELSSHMVELKKAEAQKDTDKATSILKRCNDITKLLNNIKNEKNKKIK